MEQTLFHQIVNNMEENVVQMHDNVRTMLSGLSQLELDVKSKDNTTVSNILDDFAVASVPHATPIKEKFSASYQESDIAIGTRFYDITNPNGPLRVGKNTTQRMGIDFNSFSTSVLKDSVSWLYVENKSQSTEIGWIYTINSDGLYRIAIYGDGMVPDIMKITLSDPEITPHSILVYLGDMNHDGTEWIGFMNSGVTDTIYGYNIHTLEVKPLIINPNSDFCNYRFYAPEYYKPMYTYIVSGNDIYHYYITEDSPLIVGTKNFDNVFTFDLTTILSDIIDSTIYTLDNKLYACVQSHPAAKVIQLSNELVIEEAFEVPNTTLLYNKHIDCAYQFDMITNINNEPLNTGFEIYPPALYVVSKNVSVIVNREFLSISGQSYDHGVKPNIGIQEVTLLRSYFNDTTYTLTIPFDHFSDTTDIPLSVKILSSIDSSVNIIFRNLNYPEMNPFYVNDSAYGAIIHTSSDIGLAESYCADCGYNSTTRELYFVLDLDTFFYMMDAFADVTVTMYMQLTSKSDNVSEITISTDLPSETVVTEDPAKITISVDENHNNWLYSWYRQDYIDQTYSIQELIDDPDREINSVFQLNGKHVAVGSITINEEKNSLIMTCDIDNPTGWTIQQNAYNQPLGLTGGHSELYSATYNGEQWIFIGMHVYNGTQCPLMITSTDLDQDWTVMNHSSAYIAEGISEAMYTDIMSVYEAQELYGITGNNYNATTCFVTVTCVKNNNSFGTILTYSGGNLDLDPIHSLAQSTNLSEYQRMVMSIDILSYSNTYIPIGIGFSTRDNNTDTPDIPLIMIKDYNYILSLGDLYTDLKSMANRVERHYIRAHQCIESTGDLVLVGDMMNATGDVYPLLWNIPEFSKAAYTFINASDTIAEYIVRQQGSNFINNSLISASNEHVNLYDLVYYGSSYYLLGYNSTNGFFESVVFKANSISADTVWEIDTAVDSSIFTSLNDINVYALEVIGSNEAFVDIDKYMVGTIFGSRYGDPVLIAQGRDLYELSLVVTKDVNDKDKYYVVISNNKNSATSNTTTLSFN